MADNKNQNPSGGKIVASSPSLSKDIGFVKTTSMQSGGSFSGRMKGRQARPRKGINKYASVGPSVSRLPSQYYNPLFEETNIQLPREPREINMWSRHFYRTDPIIATGLDFHSQFPITAFYNEMPESDPYIQKFFDEMAFDELRLKELMLYISHEYWVLGNCFPFAEWDNDEGKWSRIILLNPDYVHIQSNPLAGEPQLQLTPDSRLEKIVNSREPRHIFNQLPPELIAKVTRGEKIPLSPDHVAHIAHKINTYDEYGTPIMFRLFKILMYKDRLREAQFAIAERHITPIQLWKLGEKGNEVNQEDMNYFSELLNKVYSDRNAAIVYGHYIDYQVVGSSGQVMPLNTEFDYINKEMLFGLGLSENIITGEGGSFAQPLIALEALINRYVIFRELLGNYISYKIYKPVAEAQGFYKKDPISGEEYLLYPRVKWSKMNVRDDQQQKQMVVGQLRAKGDVSIKTVLKLFDMDYETEKQNLEEEMMTIFNPGVKAIKNAEAVRPQLPSIPSYAEGKDKERLGVQSKWKDYVIYMVDEELKEGVKAGAISQEEADKARRDIIDEVTVGVSESIITQIENAVMKELQKSLSSGDMTAEQAMEVKYDVMKDVAKDYEIPGAGIFVETIKNIDEQLKSQVDAKLITPKDAEIMKKEILDEIAKEEMDKIIKAHVESYRLVKTAVSMTRRKRMGFKVGKFVKVAENKKLAHVENIVGEVMEEEKSNGSSKDKDEVL